MTKRNKLLVVAASLLAVIILASGSLAAFTTQGKARNQITASNVRAKLILEEKQEDGTYAPAPATINANPGATSSRIARAQNVGDEPFWLRGKVTFTVDGKDVSSQVTVSGTDSAWEQGTDGYWYYNEAIEPGLSSNPLLTDVKLSETMGNDLAGKQLTMDVELQATQTEHNGTSAKDAAGWPTEEA